MRGGHTQSTSDAANSDSGERHSASSESDRSQVSDACPTSDEIAAFIEHRLPSAAEAAMEAHVAACDRCRELISALCRADSAMGEAPRSTAVTRVANNAASSSLPSGESTWIDLPLRAGTAVGRYTILDRIGAGGMGVVYAALDAELERKVAIKMLRAGRSAADRAADYEARLVTEARAMAQLSHPNVVAVFEIGRFGDQMFLVMELVDGETLSHWIAEKPRGWREIVAMFVAAGQGLAAAHSSGLVHRDFKPANVLVGRDGRVRVTDFGLAQDDARDNPSRAVAGTPYYMAPEQFRGDAADARTDQFNFCVALYRALYDEHPFAGATKSELADSVTSGRLRPLPATARVPRRLGRTVVRGLSSNPDHRYRSMEELLGALQSEPYRRVRRAVGAVAIASIAVAVSLLYRRTSDTSPTCAEVAGRGVAVWSPERQHAVERAFLDSGKPFARTAFAEVERVVGRYQASWTDMRVDLCEAARTASGSADELIGLRTTCLDRRLSELRALVSVLATASADVVQNAPGAVHALSDLGECVDPRVLLGPDRPPSDPVARAQIDSLRDELAAAQALRRVGRHADALDKAQQLVDRVGATHYRPLEAETLLLVGTSAFDSGKYPESERALKNALFAAEAGRSDQVVIMSLLYLMYFDGIVQARYEQAIREHAPRINAILERLGGNAELEGLVHSVVGWLWMGASRYDEAEAEGRLAFEILERHFGPGDLRIARALETRIWSAMFRNDGHTMLALAERGVTIRTEVFGEEHPDVATAYFSLALALWHTERWREARAAFERALTIRARALGPDHLEMADLFLALASYDESTGHLAEGLARGQRALTIVKNAIGGENAVGGEGRMLGQALAGVAQNLTSLHRDTEALASVREAEPLLVSTVGEQSMAMSEQRLTMSRALVHLGRYAEAREQVQTSLKILDHLLGPDHAWGAWRHHILGQIELARGRPKQALASLERARKLASPGDGSFVLLLADINFDSARALALLHQDPARAYALAESARATMVDCPELGDKVRQIEAWLVRHPEPRAIPR
jgi:tetratricopeptide (TPR) repeat protein